MMQPNPNFCCGMAGGLLKLNIGTLLVAVAALAFLALNSVGMPWTAMRIAGLAIFVPSILLLMVARMQLGRAFTVQAKATMLVTTGLYARIRNPIYLFGGLALAGILLWMNRPWFLLAFVVLVPMQLGRIRREEQVLSERFGAAYEEYRRRTWF